MLIPLHGPKVGVGRAVVFVGFLLAVCWMVRPPVTYVTVYNEEPKAPPEK